MLAAAAVAATPSAAPQAIQAEDDSSLATDLGGTTSSTNFPVHTPLRPMACLVGGRVSEGSELVKEVIFLLLISLFVILILLISFYCLFKQSPFCMFSGLLVTPF